MTTEKPHYRFTMPELYGAHKYGNHRAQNGENSPKHYRAEALATFREHGSLMKRFALGIQQANPVLSEGEILFTLLLEYLGGN